MIGSVLDWFGDFLDEYEDRIISGLLLVCFALLIATLLLTLFALAPFMIPLVAISILYILSPREKRKRKNDDPR